MRRLALPALLGLLAALPASAQSQFADSAGTYVAVDGFPVAYGGSGLGLRLGTSVEVGRRFGNGFDAGLTGSYVASGTRTTEWSVGVTGGVARPAPFGTVARLQATATYGATAYDYDGRSFDRSGLGGDVSATLSRSIPIAGSVRIQPTVGVFATVGQTLAFDGTGVSDPLPEAFTRMGLQVELPITFRLFGADAAFVPGVRIGLSDGRYFDTGGVSGAAFRLNF